MSLNLSLKLITKLAWKYFHYRYIILEGTVPGLSCPFNPIIPRGIIKKEQRDEADYNSFRQQQSDACVLH